MKNEGEQGSYAQASEKPQQKEEREKIRNPRANSKQRAVAVHAQKDRMGKRKRKASLLSKRCGVPASKVAQNIRKTGPSGYLRKKGFLE